MKKQALDNRVLKFIMHMVLIGFSSLAILPQMTLDLSQLLYGYESGMTPSDNFYSSRIYAQNEDLLYLGNFYAEKEINASRKFEIASFGETILRVLFKLSNLTPVAHYLITSWLILTLWIYLLWKILSNNDRSIRNTPGFPLLLLGLIAFFGNSNILDSQYMFARIVSPQVHGLLWLTAIYLLKGYFIEQSRSSSTKRLLFFGLLTSFSLFIYPFLYLTLLSTSLVMSTLLIYRKRYRTFVQLVLLVAPSVLILLRDLQDRKSQLNGSETAERHGLLESHFPGALYPFSVSVLIIGVVLAKLIITRRRYFSPVERALIFSSIGLIASSQSNLITGESVQFSDHFNTFASLNLIILLVSIFSEPLMPEKASRLLRQGISRIVLGTIIVLSCSNILSINLAFKFKGPPYLDTKLFVNQNVIVDSNPIREYFVTYNASRILFDSSLWTYSFSNAELMERLYISTGCPRNFEVRDLLPITAYRYAPYDQKAARLQSLNLDGVFGDLVKSEIDGLRKVATKRRQEIEQELQQLLTNIGGKDCLALAKDYNIAAIIFDRKSGWYSSLNRELFDVKNLGGTNLFYVRI